MSGTIDQGMKRLNEYIRLVLSRYGFERIVLFGSHAKGRARPDSDFDLAFFVEDRDYDRAHELAIELLLASKGFEIDIEPHIYPVAAIEDDNHLFVHQEVLPNSVELYRRAS